MKKNIGYVDRILRVFLGLAIIVCGVIYNSWLILVGGIILMTSVFSWCPVYTPFNFSTKRENSTRK